MKYDSLTLKHNDYPDGGLDKDTGIFVSPKSGVFATSFFFSADNNVNRALQADLHFQKNSKNLAEGRM